jgi:hypothetical protein
MKLTVAFIATALLALVLTIPIHRATRLVDLELEEIRQKQSAASRRLSQLEEIALHPEVKARELELLQGRRDVLRARCELFERLASSRARFNALRKTAPDGVRLESCFEERELKFSGEDVEALSRLAWVVGSRAEFDGRAVRLRTRVELCAP